MKYIFIILFLSLGYFVSSVNADEEKYKKVLAKYKVDEKQKNHKIVATWCKKNKHKKYKYHLNRYYNYLFFKKEGNLTDNPKSTDLKRMYKLAIKYQLKDKENEYRNLWGAAEVDKKIKSTDLEKKTKVSSLTKWILDNQFHHTKNGRDFVYNYCKSNPDDEKTNRKFGNIKLDDTWHNFDDLEDKWFKNIELRMKLHEEMAVSRSFFKTKYKKWQADPLSKVTEKFFDAKIKSITKGNRKFRYAIWAKKQSKPSQPRPLIICFHGGGSGGAAVAQSAAQTELLGVRGAASKHMSNAVVLIPMASKHVANSWGEKSNIMDWLDALDDIFHMFPIDRKKIYLTGYSMGSNGICQYSFITPEIAAAYSFGGCSVWKRPPPKTILKKPFLIFHGLKEPKWRNDAKSWFIKTVESKGGTVNCIDFPQYGHAIPSSEIENKLVLFFKKNKNNIIPDFKVIRKVYELQ